MKLIYDNRMLEFSINPPLLTPWLSDEIRDRNIVLLDLQIDQEEEYKLRFDLDIAFNPMTIRRGSVVRKDYYVGCTGAEIFFAINDGEIIDFTQGSTLNVEYKNEKKFIRRTSLNLSPEIKIAIDKSEKKVKLGSITHDASKSVSFSANFQSGERTLQHTHLNNSIKWQISLPRGEKVVRDYLLGNLYLYTVCTSKNGVFCGKVRVKPSDVIFFGSDKRPLSLRKSIYMRYLLYREGISIDNADGIETNFNQNRNENERLNY